MCDWGSHKKTMVYMSPELSHTGKERLALKGIDSCIADIVHALNAAGIKTRTCCCGHNKADSIIDFEDGRQIIIRCCDD